jgi:chemotaxis response regulator CheB
MSYRILTGMGADGAQGLLEMRQAAVELGAAERVLGLDQIPREMLRLATG